MSSMGVHSEKEFQDSDGDTEVAIRSAMKVPCVRLDLHLPDSSH